MLSIYASQEDVPRALELFKEIKQYLASKEQVEPRLPTSMKERKLRQTERHPAESLTVLYNILINMFTKLNRPEEVAKCLEEMKREDIVPDAGTYSTLLTLWTNQPNPEEGLNVLLAEIEARNVEWTTDMYNTLLSYYGKIPDAEKITEIFKEMIGKGLKPDTSMCNIILGMYADHKRYDLVSDFIDYMNASKIMGDDLSFSILLKMHYNRGSIEESTHIFNEVLQSEQASKFTSMYYSMISLYCKAMDLRRAMHVLMSMTVSSKNREVDGVATHSSREWAESALSESDAMEGVADVESETEEQGVLAKRARDRARKRFAAHEEADLVFFAGEWSPAPRPLRGFSVASLKEWMRPKSTLQYNILLDLFAKLLYKPAVVNIRRDMAERGYRPSIHTYTILFLLHIRMRSGNRELQQCLDEMVSNGLEPNDHLYCLLIRLADDLPSLKSYRACIKNQRAPRFVAKYMGALAKLYQSDELLAFWTEYRLSFEPFEWPPVTAYKAAVKCFAFLRRMDDAVDVLEDFDAHVEPPEAEKVLTPLLQDRSFPLTCLTPSHIERLSRLRAVGPNVKRALRERERQFPTRYLNKE